MNVGQGDASPLGPGVKSYTKLSRMLGSGLAEMVVLELDLELDGVCDPTATENVVVIERLADVFECSEDFVVDSGSSGLADVFEGLGVSVVSSESSDVARLYAAPLSIPCSGSAAQPWPSRCSRSTARF